MGNSTENSLWYSWINIINKKKLYIIQNFIEMKNSFNNVRFELADNMIGCLFGFYGISTFVGHLTPNSVYKYIHIQPKISKRILR